MTHSVTRHHITTGEQVIRVRFTPRYIITEHQERFRLNNGLGIGGRGFLRAWIDLDTLEEL